MIDARLFQHVHHLRNAVAVGIGFHDGGQPGVLPDFLADEVDVFDDGGLAQFNPRGMSYLACVCLRYHFFYTN